MNGTNATLDVSPLTDRRPVVTCAGELEVFSVIEDNIAQALGQEACEWRRLLGRPTRSVHITATFTPFSPAGLPKGNQWDLIRNPLFHIYWTDCSDVDVYKTNVRDDIDVWLKELQNRDISDWLIVVVENYDGKRANKLLPRTTVLDKIKADFGTKQGDRCISVINPGKTESRSADSWRSLITRIRYLLLVAYARAISLLEEYVTQQRERRNEHGWNFMNYFKLQEELAQVLEMLGIYDEALVQYDELDALFTHFVTTGHANSDIAWLDDFRKPLEKWHGLKLGPSMLPTKPSILELRAYLFAKQSHMLLLTNKIWEMAARCIPFLHTCVRELTLLEVTATPGAISCWLFLASLEVLQTCDKFNHADSVKEYSLNTACLWDYASQKLRSLGELCGLLPGGRPSSEQLHIVVGLSAGMGDNPGGPGSPSPTDKLKEALCSQDVFRKNYLELAELAMGTYKHIGRIRSARLVGRDLASFYMLLNETQKSAAFLGDLVKTFEENGWQELAAQTQLELAECHRKANNGRKFVKACLCVCAAPEIDNLLRWSYFDDMRRFLEDLEEPLVVPLEKVVRIVSVQVKNEGPIMQDCELDVELVVDSSFPRDVLCSGVLMSLECENEGKNDAINCRVPSANNLKSCNLSKELKMFLHLDYKQDKQLSSASVVCKNIPVKRKDSAAVPQKTNFNECLEVNKLPLVLTPGINVIRLSKKASNVGKHTLSHLAIHIRNLHLSGPVLQQNLTVEVKRQEPTVRLDSTVDCLLSGFEQDMVLTLTVGSYFLEPNCVIKLAASMGLLLQYKRDEPLINALEIEVSNTEPFASTRVPIRILAENPSKDHQVTITCPWSTKPVPVTLNFASPLSTSWKLHTVHQRKFVQIVVTGQCDKTVVLVQPRLIVGHLHRVIDKNPSSSHVVTYGTSISYIWELIVQTLDEAYPVKVEFTVKYKIQEVPSAENVTYRHFFNITNHETLYILEAHVEPPTKGGEFCRVGALCHLHLTIRCVERDLERGARSGSLMYEVLAEQSVWAVCGRTAGVVCFDSDCDPQNVILDVMPLTSGFLPLPLVSVSRYIPAETASSERSGKLESQPRLEPFGPGQVYNSSKGQQVHVIAAVNEGYVV